MSGVEHILDRLKLINEEGLPKKGLHYFQKKESWKDKFPFSIKNALDKIKPTAFYFYDNPDRESANFFNSPFILFFDISGIHKNEIQEKKKTISRSVWNFNQAPVVFLINDQEIEIYNGFIFDKDESILKKIGGDEEVKDFSFWKLSAGEVWKKYQKIFDKNKRIDFSLLNNIEYALKELLNAGLEKKIANRLIGLLIFSRYLIDRKVEINFGYIQGSTYEIKKRIDSFNKLILDKEKLRKYFVYLKDQFNGDLFTFDEKEWDEVQSNHLNILYRLFSSEDMENKQPFLFDVYDFSIIPIELISNIYELFIGKENQIKSKSFYTPSFLVNYILSQTIEPFFEKPDKAECMVLDPACGSGIFLVETLRKLIEKEKKVTGIDKVPDERLKELVKNNIFGIDIDEKAIEIAIFSLYITLLDYKEPKEIEKFTFPKLKDSNFFNADFFDEEHEFNEIIKNKELDFIIGNPPWGQPKQKKYLHYMDKHKITISDKQIAQSFLVRTGDFANKNTKLSLIVTSKILYNLSAKANEFRQYFLNNFFIDKVFELSPVHDNVFVSAKCPAAIIFYRSAFGDNTSNNIIHHISLKPNLFFKLFKTFVIEKVDYKKIQQKYFMKYDWLWKVMLYGSALDFHFIKRILESYKKLEIFLTMNQIVFGAGYKIGNKSKIKYTLKNMPVITPQQVKPFAQNLDFEKVEDIVPDLMLEDDGILEAYNAPHLLIKRSTTKPPIITYLENSCAFPNTIYGISGDWSKKDIIKSIGGLISSSLTKYILSLTSSEWGIERSEIYKKEYELLPVPDNLNETNLNKYFSEIIEIAKEKYDLKNFMRKKDFDEEINKKIELINQEVYNLFELNEIEKDLIDYAVNISIPIFRNSEESLKIPLEKANEDQLKEYADLFYEEFGSVFNANGEFFKIEIYQTDYFTAMNFKIVYEKPVNKIEFPLIKDINQIVDQIAGLSLEKITDDLFIQRDIKGFETDSFFIVKPNEYKNWHRAVARLDLAEFMDAMMIAGKKEMMEKAHV